MFTNIQKRTKYVINDTLRKWQDRWWKFIIDHPDRDWNWFNISRNPNITMQDILDNPTKPWDWFAISNNPTITMDFINDNPDKDWNWYAISRHIFLKDKEEFVIKMYREHLAAILIQNAYKNALVNPNCKIGINKIERDMDELGLVNE